jgi:hypothetical protein
MQSNAFPGQIVCKVLAIAVLASVGIRPFVLSMFMFYNFGEKLKLVHANA